MKLISFGDLSIRNLYPFIASIAFVARTICITNVKLTLRNDFHDYLISPLFITITMFTAESMIGFIELILYFNQSNKFARTNSIESREAVIKHPFSLIEEQTNNHAPIKKVLIISLLAFLDGSFVFIDNVIEKTFKNVTYLSFEMRGFQLFILVVLSYFFLKQKIFRHQCVSIVIIVCGFLLSTIMEVIDRQNDYFQILFHFLNYSVLASRDTTENGSWKLS